MKFKKKILIFITGAPASGKDTQANLLAKKLKAKKITISDVLKKFFENKEKKFLRVGREIINLNKEKEKFFQGQLVSFKFVSWIVTNLINEHVPLKKNLIIVGSPRSLIEAKTCLNLVTRKKINHLFIFLKISEEEIYKRTAKRQRIDDLEKIVKIRIENFKKYTLPILDYLKRKGEIVEINGEGSVKEIHQYIWKIVKSKLI